MNKSKQLLDLLEDMEKPDNWNEMEDFFKKRTAKHIALVQKWAKKIEDYDPVLFKGLLQTASKHDASKYREPEYTPYVYITWDYKCKEEGTKCDLPKDIKSKMDVASNAHITNNSHHPESWSLDKIGIMSRDDRDKASDKIIDATSMSDLSIGEMCADFMAMSEELGNSPIAWADKNVNKKWKFTDKQKKLIYELLDLYYKN